MAALCVSSSLTSLSLPVLTSLLLQRSCTHPHLLGPRRPHHSHPSSSFSRQRHHTSTRAVPVSPSGRRTLPLHRRWTKANAFRDCRADLELSLDWRRVSGVCRGDASDGNGQAVQREETSGGRGGSTTCEKSSDHHITITTSGNHQSSIQLSRSCSCSDSFNVKSSVQLREGRQQPQVDLDGKKVKQVWHSTGRHAAEPQDSSEVASYSIARATARNRVGALAQPHQDESTPTPND